MKLRWLGTLLALCAHLPLLASQGVSCRVLDGGMTDCSNRGLTYVPRNLPSTTRHLRLDGNSIEQIEAADFPTVMAELEELTLSENLIHHIDTSTFCHKLPNLKILRLTKNKLSTLPDLSFCSSLVELHSASNQIVRLDGKSISGLTHLEKLDLSKNNLTNITASMLPTNTSLKQLFLNNNEISTMNSGAFANVPTLERLKLTKNRLTSIPSHSFSDLHNLLILDLSKNRLTVIEHEYFINLQKVKVINLERNKLSALLDGSFYECKALESLNLGSNLLNSIEAGPFFGLDNLRELLLSKNNISSIAVRVWTHAPLITILDVSNNELQVLRSTDFTSASQMATLTLANNKIKQIEENAFIALTNLDTLDLSRNELSDRIQSPSTTVFSALTKLSSLNLKSNSIQTITSKLLKGLEALQTLELSNNPVTTVDSYAFSALPKLNMLGLVTEKMVCDCKISWLPPWLQSKHLSSTVDVKCSLPRVLRGQDIFSINNSQFICDAEMPIRPFITREIQPTNALKNSNVTLTCIATASSQSPVIVEWRKDNEVIPESSGLIHTEASTDDDRVSLHTTYLKLVNIDEHADGYYQCRFKNDFGEDYSERAQLQVLVFPSFTNIPSNVEVKTGQDAKLLCEATGDPQPFLSWSKDGGKNFPAARDRRFQVNPVNLNEFIIKDVESLDMGVYYCNATNIAGSIISNATVNVMVPPMFTEDISCTNTKAGAYLLKCEATANPTTPIVWYKDGKVIQASEKYVFSAVTFNNLFILGATAEDSGIYMCSACNLLGKVTQKCEINIRDPTTEVTDVIVNPIKKPTVLEKNTITGLIVIAVVCCVVGTSLIWVVIIYQTRRRQNRNGSNETEETTVPLNEGNKTASNSTHKIGDSISNSSGSSQTKTDSFFEYRGDSPSAFFKAREKYPTMESELAAAMEPLNPNQDSIDSLAHEAHTNSYSHHTVGASRLCSRMPMSVSDYYASERPTAHPFSTFQPSRHNRTPDSSMNQRGTKPSHSISAEYIPYIDRRLPPHLSQVLHQLQAPAQLPHAVVVPVHSHHSPVADSSHHSANHYEDPEYMNLPRSAVTHSRPKKRNVSEEHSDYMNVAPKDIHIYQNSSILSITPHTNNNDGAPHDGDTYTQGTAEGSPSASNGASNSTLPLADSCQLSPISPSTHNSNQINSEQHSRGTDTNIDPVNPNTSTSINSPDNRSLNCTNSSKYISRRRDTDCSLSGTGRRREGLADSSFVERKYGLIFTGDVGRVTKQSDLTQGSHNS